MDNCNIDQSNGLQVDIRNNRLERAIGAGQSQTWTYDAFGNITASSTGAWTGPFGYGGKFGYQEDTTGLQLLGHRHYDPSLGRFLTRDPIKDARNWYAYCENDPVNATDPTGLFWASMALKSLEDDPPFGGRGDSPSDQDVRDPVLHPFWEWWNFVRKLPADGAAPPNPGDALEPIAKIPYKDLDARRQILEELYTEDPVDGSHEKLKWYQDPQYHTAPYTPSW